MFYLCLNNNEPHVYNMFQILFAKMDGIMISKDPPGFCKPGLQARLAMEKVLLFLLKWLFG